MKAGSACFHAGKIGSDGLWVRDLMEKSGVDTRLLLVEDNLATGTAIIQICETTKQNAILIWSGGNGAITIKDVENTIRYTSNFTPWGYYDWLVVQNELLMTPLIINEAHSQGMWVAYNPAPLNQDLVKAIPFDKIDILVLNESEAEEMLLGLFPIEASKFSENMNTESWIKLGSILASYEMLQNQLQWLIITLGKFGAIALSPNSSIKPISLTAFTPPRAIQDTTGAGDTFFGYFVCFLANLKIKKGTYIEPDFIKKAIKIASAASAIAVTVPGAMASIPSKAEVLNWFPDC